jgi:hypothetical protein
VTEKNSAEARSPNDGKLEELLRLYRLTAARERVHRAKGHAQDGYVASFDYLMRIP